MYVDIRMLSLLKECLFQVGEKFSADLVLNRVVRDFKTYKQVLYENPFILNVRKVDQLFEGYLGELYEARKDLIKLVLNQISSQSLKASLQAIENEMDEIIRTLNMKGDVPEDILSAWETSFDLFLQGCGRDYPLSQKKLQRFCGATYYKIARTAEIRFLYLSWESYLQSQIQPLVQEKTRLSAIKYGLKIRQLVLTTKNDYFEQFFRKVENQKLAIISCAGILRRLSEGSNSDMLVKILTQEIQAAQKRIAVSEKKLLKSIDRFSYFTAILIHPFIHNLYVREAQFLVESQDRATQTSLLNRVSFLSIPLENSYLTFSKTMTIIGLVTLDISEWKWLGISHRFLSALSEPLMPSSTNCLQIFQRMGRDEKTALLYLPVLREGLGFMLLMAIAGSSSGFATLILAKMALSYSLGKIVSLCAGQTVNYLYRLRKNDYETSPTYPLMQGLVQRMAFPLVHWLVVPYLFEKLNAFASPEDVLMNEAACVANPLACKQEAYNILGLSETASIQDVKRAYRQLALRYHPDHNSSSLEMFRRLTRAKDYALKHV